MPAGDRVALASQVRREVAFDLRGRLMRHRIDMVMMIGVIGALDASGSAARTRFSRWFGVLTKLPEGAAFHPGNRR